MKIACNSIEKNVGVRSVINYLSCRDVYLNGNNLEAEGAIELIKLSADQAEVESLQRAEEKQRKAEEEALALLAGLG